MSFTPPSNDLFFALKVNAGIAELAAAPRFAAASDDLVAAVGRAADHVAPASGHPYSESATRRGPRQRTA